MTVHAEKVETPISFTCGYCYSVALLPTWVTMEAEMERAVFQCPVCNSEAEIDIDDYPKTRVRVVVNEW